MDLGGKEIKYFLWDELLILILGSILFLLMMDMIIIMLWWVLGRWYCYGYADWWCVMTMVLMMMLRYDMLIWTIIRI